MKAALFPSAPEGRRPPVRLDPPRLAARTDERLAGLGYTCGGIDALRERAVVA